MSDSKTMSDELNTATDNSEQQAIVVVSVDGTITQWNSAAENLFGYAAQEAIGASLDLIVPAEHQAAHWAGFSRAMITPELKRLAADLPVRCADDQVRHFAGSLTVVIDGLGRAAGAVAVFRGNGSTGFRPFG